MARRVIIGTGTWSSQANRDAARTRVDAALVGVPYENYTLSPFPGGINNSGTTVITISITIEDRDTADATAKAIYSAWVQSNRHSSGWLSVNRI